MKNEASEDEKVVNKQERERERERESCDKKSGQKSFHHATFVGEESRQNVQWAMMLQE